MGLTQVSTGGIKNATIKNEDIEADTIQLTKVQEMATNHILGRSTSGTGNPEIIGAAQTRTILNVADGATNTVINNNADNRIIRGSNTANTLNAHTNVTINSSGHLNMGSPTSHYGITLAQGDYAVNRIGWADAGSTKRASIACKATGDVLSFTMGSSDSEKMRLDTNGRLMIGTDTEGHPAGDNLTVADTGHAGISIRSGTTSNGALYFSRGTSGGNEYRGAVVYHHDGNYLRFYTNGTEELRLHSGGGISFNGDSASANALNDYEEGTWTPTISQGFSSVQYETNGRQGSYTKIGRYVFFTLMIHLGGTTATTSSGIEITGLPFNAKSFSHDNAAAGGADPFYQDAFYNANDFSALVADGDAKLQLVRRDTGAALTGTSVNAGREFRMTGTYMT